MSGRVLHCWKDQHEHMAEVHGFGSQEWIDSFDPGGTCMLEAGHGGEHDFTPDDEIGVTFEPMVLQ